MSPEHDIVRFRMNGREFIWDPREGCKLAFVSHEDQALLDILEVFLVDAMYHRARQGEPSSNIIKFMASSAQMNCEILETWPLRPDDIKADA